MSNSLGSIKRGDTFNYYATWEGAALAELRSHVRTDTGRLLSVVEIYDTETPSTFQLIVPDTTNWPIGTVYTDIERIVGGVIKSTETLTIDVQKDVTQWQN